MQYRECKRAINSSEVINAFLIASIPVSRSGAPATACRGNKENASVVARAPFAGIPLITHIKKNTAPEGVGRRAGKIGLCRRCLRIKTTRTGALTLVPPENVLWPYHPSPSQGAGEPQTRVRFHWVVGSSRPGAGVRCLSQPVCCYCLRVEWKD